MSGTASAATAASSRTGCANFGPSPSAKLRPRPIASGTVRMSLNRIAASSAIALQRLQRHLGGVVGVGRQAHEAAGLGARGAVLGQVAAGLAHQPDGRVVGGLAQAGAQEAVVVERCVHRSNYHAHNSSRPNHPPERPCCADTILADHRQHAAHPHQPPVRRRPTGLHQERAQQPGRLDQGPHRAVDGRSGRGLGRAEAGRHHHRADLGQHRRRPGDGGRGEGLQAGAGDARQHEHRAAPPDAGLRRELRADAARKRHEGRDRPRHRTGRRDARRVDAAAVREPGQHRRACAHHGAGDRRRLSRGHRRADHRRRHRRPHHRLRAGAEGEVAEAEGVRGRAGRLAR